MIDRLVTPFIAVLAAGLLVAGCGDSNSGADAGSEQVTASSLSKAAFVAKAQAICNRRLNKVYSYEGEELVDAVLPNFGAIADEIRELGAPSGDEAKIQAYVDALESGLDKLDEQQQNGPIKLNQISLPLKPSAKLARQYGISRCAFASTS